MADVSFLGSKITVISVPTFPQGFTIEHFSDDADPITFDAVEIKGAAMGVNGDKITWKRPNLKPVTLNVIPNSSEDQNLGILYATNAPAKNKVSIDDDITIIVQEASGKVTTCVGGTIISGDPANSATSDGRIKTKSYSFVFEKII